MLLTLILNLDMAAGNTAPPPTPSPGNAGGGGVWRRRRDIDIKPPRDMVVITDDGDLIHFIKAFLDVEGD